MMNKVKELRTILPIPINEALELLRANDGDIETCVYLYKAKALEHICSETGCDKAMADHYYEAEKYDINRAISFINDELFDRNYTPIDGVTFDGLQTALYWLRLIETKDFAYSLSFSRLDEVIDVMLRIEPLHETADMLRKAKAVYDRIFEGYSDNLPIEEFVRRYQQLDHEVDFMNADYLIPLRRIVIAEELRRHLRNLEQ
ncbi:hypothetical protein [Dysgonomonas sp. 25]|uniref:hypothetical protein n=1 Tax=Dysgonomonas sp. 25 TaxID=2302933 RepID=UPI0013D4A1E5|nr:hypothetical protein [Dysgonomonas sp. 25]NDV69291.1 hypothetical protein [Dysgonomonas sp. 25]